MTKERNPRRGFTLIELLVVVLIIGILAAVAVPQYQKAVEKSKVSAILPVLSSIVNAMEIYYLTNGTWPTNISDLDVNIDPSQYQGFNIIISSKGTVVESVYVRRGIQVSFGTSHSLAKKVPPYAKRCWPRKDASNYAFAESVCKALGTPVTCNENTCYEIQ